MVDSNNVPDLPKGRIRWLFYFICGADSFKPTTTIWRWSRTNANNLSSPTRSVETVESLLVSISCQQSRLVNRFVRGASTPDHTTPTGSIKKKKTGAASLHRHHLHSIAAHWNICIYIYVLKKVQECALRIWTHITSVYIYGIASIKHVGNVQLYIHRWYLDGGWCGAMVVVEMRTQIFERGFW